MKKIFFPVIFIFVFCFSAFAQVEKQTQITDPDVFYKMSWKKEKLKLDYFAGKLKKDKNKIGIITLSFDEKKTKSEIKNRSNRISYYLIKTQKIDKSQFKLVFSNSSEETTMYWIVDKSEISEN